MKKWSLLALSFTLLVLVGCSNPAPTPVATATPTVAVIPSGPTQATLDAVNKDLASWKDRATISEADLAKAQADAAKAQQGLAKAQADFKAYKPDLPQPKAIIADPATTALLILDLNNAKIKDPTNPANALGSRLKGLLDKTRAAKVFTIYTISLSGAGTSDGSLWDGFGQTPSELILTPDGFDKFYGGELQNALSKKGIKTLIVTGSSSNFAVLYTGTSAARVFNYDVVIPVDGIVAGSDYQQDYAIYQFTVLPGNYSKKFSFTTVDQLSFK